MIKLPNPIFLIIVVCIDRYKYIVQDSSGFYILLYKELMYSTTSIIHSLFLWQKAVLRCFLHGDRKVSASVVSGLHMNGREALSHTVEEWGYEHVCQTPPHHLHWWQEHQEALDHRHHQPARTRSSGHVRADAEKSCCQKLQEMIRTLGYSLNFFCTGFKKVQCKCSICIALHGSLNISNCWQSEFNISL